MRFGDWRTACLSLGWCVIMRAFLAAGAPGRPQLARSSGRNAWAAASRPLPCQPRATSTLSATMARRPSSRPARSFMSWPGIRSARKCKLHPPRHRDKSSSAPKDTCSVSASTTPDELRDTSHESPFITTCRLPAGGLLLVAVFSRRDQHRTAMAGGGTYVHGDPGHGQSLHGHRSLGGVHPRRRLAGVFGAAG